MLVFLLRNQLLVQLHTYFYLFPPASNSELFKVEQGNDDAGGMANGHEGRRQQLSPRVGFLFATSCHSFWPYLPRSTLA
jgi:hypothetical protein